MKISMFKVCQLLGHIILIILIYRVYGFLLAFALFYVILDIRIVYYVLSKILKNTLVKNMLGL